MHLPTSLDVRRVAMMTLIQHELLLQPHVALSLPFPAIAARCRAFLKAPNTHDTINGWSASLNMSRRAFTRAFKAEAGLSFVVWRQQACLVTVMPRLVAGEAITTVALDLGYDNPAAFTTMFKRSLGSGLIEFHSQKRTVAASMIAEKKVSGHRSYRVATRRQSLRRPNMISMRLRRL